MRKMVVNTLSSSNHKYVDLTPDEIAELAAIQLVTHVWDIDKPVRVIIPAEVREGWLMKKREHEETFELTGISLYPDLIALLEFVKYEMANDTFIVNGNTNIYVYLDYLLPEHEAIIVKWGGIVELKTN
jgi:hypothetical protein